MEDERYKRGWELIQAIHNTVADKTVGGVAEVAPALGEMIVSFAYGDVMARPGLDVKTRQICIVAMLAAMGGHTAPELKAHIRGALRVGWTKDEIAEVLIQTAVYAGFPAAINAVEVAKAVYAAWDDEQAVANAATEGDVS
ncbi:MAG TPA: carboxymuconolactone decarboxylase family protein [Capsulimonadaceae bacterium]|jgi:4-carboxymuconolactone decarboxylase